MYCDDCGRNCRIEAVGKRISRIENLVFGYSKTIFCDTICRKIIGEQYVSDRCPVSTEKREFTYDNTNSYKKL